MLRFADLDVVLTHLGQVCVLDEDEFAQHRVSFGYLPELVRAAREAADRAIGLLKRRDPPFDGAADRWHAMIDPASHG